MPNVEEVKHGKCTNCDRQVLDLTKKGSKRFLPNYCEQEMELSNGTLMRVAVCSDCKATLVNESEEATTIANNILDRHKVWWSNNLRDNDPRMPAFHLELQVEDVNSNAEKFIEKTAERNLEKAQVRQWQKDKADFEMVENRKNETLPEDKKKPEIKLPKELADYQEWKKKHGVKSKVKVK